MYFHPKMAWPPATYEVISRNHSNWLSLNLSQNVRQGWTNSYWKRHVLMFHHPLGKKKQKNLMKGGGGHPPPCTSLVPRFQKYFSVSCNYLQLWERYVTRNIVTISVIEFAVVQLKDKAPPRNKSCHLYFGGKKYDFPKNACVGGFSISRLHRQSTADHSNLQGKSTKVRVIGSLRQITGSKEISKWMGRECNKQQSIQEWTLNLNWSDKVVKTKSWLGWFEVNPMFRTSVHGYFPGFSRACNMVGVIAGRIV